MAPSSARNLSTSSKSITYGTLSILSVLDVFHRQYLALHPAQNVTGADVADVLCCRRS